MPNYRLKMRGFGMSPLLSLVARKESSKETQKRNIYDMACLNPFPNGDTDIFCPLTARPVSRILHKKAA
jgi:hypothetical protein